jgi:ATP synthase protein I
MAGEDDFGRNVGDDAGHDFGRNVGDDAGHDAGRDVGHDAGGNAGRKRTSGPDRDLARAVGRREARKLRARREGAAYFWYWFGMFGLVGWAVAIPTLAGIALGVWLDRVRSDPFSWTLMLLFLGVVVGCLNAWYWVQKEQKRR